MKPITKTLAGVDKMEREAYKQHTGIYVSDPWTVIQSAWQNADDTMLEEGHKDWHSKERLSELWVSYFFATLVSILSEPKSYGLSLSTIRWFERRGIIA